MPWQVALVRPNGDDPFCGGTLISNRHVLTAAHCTGVNGGIWDIIVGEHSTTNSADGTRHTKCRAVDHPQYNSSTTNNDYAIVHLNQPVQLGPRAMHACLPTSSMGGDFLAGKTLTVSGWGARSPSDGGPNVLHKVDIPGVTNAACARDWFPGQITNKMLCAGSDDNSGSIAIGACFGDSGGKHKVYNKFTS